MQYVPLRAALDMLPRYGNSRRCKWNVNGPQVMTNSKIIPPKILRLLEKIVHRFDDSPLSPVMKWVDVTGNNIWVLHRCLKARNLQWLYQHLKTFQKLPRWKLPIYVFYKGRIIIWNGTHRMTLGRLMRKKIRARVIDLDAFIRWEKKHGKAKRKQRRA